MIVGAAGFGASIKESINELSEFASLAAAG
jgi:hypothetical protein